MPTGSLNSMATASRKSTSNERAKLSPLFLDLKTFKT